jgi:hypothetical protein
MLEQASRRGIDLLPAPDRFASALSAVRQACDVITDIGFEVAKPPPAAFILQQVLKVDVRVWHF